MSLAHIPTVDLNDYIHGDEATQKAFCESVRRFFL